MIWNVLYVLSFALASVFAGLWWVFERLATGCNWVEGRLKTAGLKARSRCDGCVWP
jgi:hypothetical protein